MKKERKIKEFFGKREVIPEQRIPSQPIQSNIQKPRLESIQPHVVQKSIVEPIQQQINKPVQQVQQQNIHKPINFHGDVDSQLHELITTTKSLINNGSFNQAKEIIDRAERLSSKIKNDSQRRKFHYGLMELKTDIKLAEL